MYVFEQDVPITAAVHAQIMERLGTEVPPGLLAHIALERADGTLRYLDLWHSREECEQFTATRLHPVVGQVLSQAGIRPAGEPPRREVRVVGVWGEAFPRQVPA